MRPKVLILVNAAWNIVNFRSHLVRGLVAAGYDVVAVAPGDAYAEAVRQLGCRFVPLAMDSGGTNILRDAMLLIRCVRLIRSERPDVILSYTVKPNIYGSFAARIAGVPIINSVEGLGATFIRTGWLTRFVSLLYKAAMAHSSVVFFLNPDDRREFMSRSLIRPEQARDIAGAGIDLEEFRPDEPQAGNAPVRPAGCTFLLIARMLYDKGIGEFVEAAQVVRRSHADARFQLLGFLDVENPAAISREQMTRWVEAGWVEYLGQTSDVRPFIRQADCVVLPSYREGLPRTLIEASAMGRPVVATDVPGCREVVDDGVTGLLCAPRDASDLAVKLSAIASLDPDARTAMGLKGREKVAHTYDVRLVIATYLQTIRSLVGSRPRAR